METRCSTLGLCRDSALTKKFDDLIWVEQKKTSEEEWSCEEVSKWAATIKAMTDDVGTFLVSIGDNGSILLDI